MAAKQGLNLVIESRDAEGKTEPFGELAAELVRLKIDVIVASNPAATFAAKSATTSIPIVMVNTPDPVQLGLVVSLGRLGGNVTGTTTLSADLSIKQLGLLIDVCISNRHLVSCTILLGHATTGQPRGAGATATARD